MRTDSPLATFLAHPDTHRRDGIKMAIIAGDTEFDSFGLSDAFSNARRRVANLFCDWRLFDRNDNDLVVDTDSMYAGLGFRPGASYLYDQDTAVTHFRYFRNRLTRDALRDWLVDDEPNRLPQFQTPSDGARISWRERETRLAQRGAASGPRPVAIIIPGIMGTHLELTRRDATVRGSGTRIWFSASRLAHGELDRIADPQAKEVTAEDLFELIYGDLADHLEPGHAVIRCPYDWRQSPRAGADELKARIAQAARENPGQPIRLLAHSMGGLVARSLIGQYPEVWQQVIDSGGRLILLGTPNNGAHTMVHTLLGKTLSIRMLERLDFAHDLQGLLEIIGGFPGALTLLPRPGFSESAGTPCLSSDAYYAVSTWQALQQKNTDRWYGDGIGAVPAAALLADSEAFWTGVLPNNEIANPERVIQVFGQSDKTPCGVVHGADGRLKLLFTADGDGWVTWASGRLDNLDADSRCWSMPVEHGDLTCTADYFPAIVELLEKGRTEKLRRLPPRRGEGAGAFVLEAPPPLLAGEDELARACVGSVARRNKASRTKSALGVAVRSGDLRFLDQPVLCGHYIGDAISGAEASLDEMLDGALAERERLGVYAADLRSSSITLRPASTEDGACGNRLGAVIVGLGKFDGQLSARQVTETVRAGVVRFLLQLRDALQVKPDEEVELYSLLIGWNSTASISVAESVGAITRGVVEANHQFRDALSRSRENGATVSRLCFIELYRNAAIAAAHAVVDLPETMASELKRLGARIDPAATLEIGAGTQDRLDVDGDLGHWSRLIVSDADADDGEDCKPRDKNPGPGQAGATSDAATGESRYYPERLKYVLLSQRARAETVVQQRQPGLIEAIIRDQRRNPAYDARLGYILFQLMIPLDYKAVAREQSRLLLVVDGYTANLPWELLQADGEPLVLRLPMVRQLATLRYRPTVRTANANTACIIAAPGTNGFDKRFGGSRQKLDPLPEATREAQAVGDSLRRAGWNDSDIVVSPADKDAFDILATLYERPYRILMIAAHGLFEATGLDGRRYSGVVLSDGLLLTAVEIDLMEVVPELVFVNCCHLGRMNSPSGEQPHNQPNQLAYSLSRKLIEMGVRCVVAAGWAVNDAAASTFASAFFDRLTQGETFGDAIFRARQAAFSAHPESNTWGAYQAYGDPGYRLQTNSDSNGGRQAHAYVALDELLASIKARRMANRRRQRNAKQPTFAEQGQWLRRQLAQCPSAWANRPEVLQAVAELYADHGEEGFAAARDAYQRAIAQDDPARRVALRAIEQLANIEARHGGKLADRKEFKPAIDLIDSAIRRLKALAESVRGDGAPAANAERAATLGSAFKLKAATLAGMGQPWDQVAPCLRDAVQAYDGGLQGDLADHPDNTLNALPLAWLAGCLEQESENSDRQGNERAARLARQCGETARQRFATSKAFWDAVMSVDAQMTAWLLGEPLQAPDADPYADSQAAMVPAQILQRRYEQAVDTLPRSAHEWDSVVRQWRLLADFIVLSGRKETIHFADALNALADQFAARCGVGNTIILKPSALTTAARRKPST